MSKQVWVEVDEVGNPIRIFYSQRRAIQVGVEGKKVELFDRSVAVSVIRDIIWDRTGGDCTWCGNPITKASLHMHEVLPRGEGGEISLDNSVGICADCHIGPQGAHGNRRPRFGENKQ